MYILHKWVNSQYEASYLGPSAIISVTEESRTRYLEANINVGLHSNVQMEVVDRVKNALLSISLEPVFFLFCVNIGLVMIPNADLYLVKVETIILHLEITGLQSEPQLQQRGVRRQIRIL